MMFHILHDKETIENGIQELSNQITVDYKDSDIPIVIICLLKGGFIFTSDLVRHIKHDVHVEFMMVSSYGDNTESSGNITIDFDISSDIQGKHVIIVDDIIDTGNTMHEIVDILKGRFPLSLKVCCLLDKKERREKEVDVDYCVFECPNKFVVGYGMDYAGKYRNLPYIGYITDLEN